MLMISKDESCDNDGKNVHSHKGPDLYIVLSDTRFYTLTVRSGAGDRTLYGFVLVCSLTTSLAPSCELRGRIETAACHARFAKVHSWWMGETTVFM
jgi:hypothetical protein